ncbi:MAG: lipid-A-disaccharide synthase [Porticoccaceae bacterium]|jgi:lipid-A-disaccharide synthase|nr:lipid-A-disaccharide synthase [Porticoccaceae bacterium]MDG1306866.1 lipid-A-disaccharide synthase [Porticoccaceae bacterium]
MGVVAPVFAMVAGEASGDVLGADLIRALKKYYPNAVFEGIGGPKMQAEGFHSLFEMDRLSVMGFVEPLKRLPELLGIRRSVIKRYLDKQPAAFIGIDSPDFNDTIEFKLHRAGVKTIHYVSPSVWAWRQGRIKKIKKSIDLMLCLLPFEAAFYEQHEVPVRFVGHPLAGQFKSEPDTEGARVQLGLDSDRPVLCIMPGSRAGEVNMMTEVFLDTAQSLMASIDGLQLIIPAANKARYAQLTGLLALRPDLDIKLIMQQSHAAMESSDVVLLASGTTALEAMLLKKPMVVSYKLGALTYKLVTPFIKTPFVSIPNLLANKMLVPELIQGQAVASNLSAAVLAALDKSKRSELAAVFAKLHDQLAVESGDIAAAAIVDLVSAGDSL